MSNKSKKHIAKGLTQAAWEELKSIGAAPGIGSRSRTFRTKEEKQNDPKRQRKQKDWLKEQN